MLSRIHHFIRLATTGGAVLVLSACQHDTAAEPTPPAPTPSLSLSLSSTTLALAGGQSTVIGVQASAQHVTSNVTLAVANLPSGWSTRFDPASLGPNGGSSQLTVVAPVNASPSTFDMQVRAVATGAPEASATAKVTVPTPPAGSFTMALTPAAMSVQAGGATTFVATITRSGSFSGPVTLSIGNLPSSVTATVSPSSVVSGTSATVLLTTVAATPAGSFGNIIVTATGTNVAPQVGTVALTVTAPPALSAIPVTVCGQSAFDLPTWVGYREDGGTWQRLSIQSSTTTSWTYSAQMARRGVLVAIVSDGTATAALAVYGTREEFSDPRSNSCLLAGGKTVFGSVSGLAASDVAYVTATGAGSATPTAASSTFSLQNLPAGPLDYIAGRVAGSGINRQLQRMIVRRGIDVPANSVLSPFAFSSSESFAPDVRRLTVQNLGSDRAVVSQAFQTARGISSAYYEDDVPSALPTRALFNVPSAVRQSSENHVANVLALRSTDTLASRLVVTRYGASQDVTAALGPYLSQTSLTPTTATVGSALKMRIPRQAEYSTGALSLVLQGSRGLSLYLVYTSAGYAASSPEWDVSFPDMSGAEGWQGAWSQQTFAQTVWAMGAVYMSDAGDLPWTEDAFLRSQTQRLALQTGVLNVSGFRSSARAQSMPGAHTEPRDIARRLRGAARTGIERVLPPL